MIWRPRLADQDCEIPRGVAFTVSKRLLVSVSILVVLVVALPAEGAQKAWRGKGFRFVIPEGYGRATQRQSSEIAARWSISSPWS